MIRKYEVNKLVSHSFGSVATTYGLSVNPQLDIDKYVLITTPDRFEERINFISSKVGITDKVKSKLINKIEKETQLEIKKLNVSDFIQSANVNQALIIHDKNDRLIPYSQAKNVNAKWPQSELISMEGTGHMKILKSDFVLDKVIEFLKK
ncbi:MAG: alpha/beta hydrolase [Bacteroidota bacterium]